VKKLLAALIMLAATLAPLPVGASAPNALSISPVRSEETVAAGTTYAGELMVENTTSKTMGVDMYAQTFFVSNQNYDYAFNESSPINQWVHFSPATFDLPSNQSQKVSYTIGVPADANPGTKYFSLFAATTNKSTGIDGISTSRRVGSLVYVTVPGDPSHKGELLGLSAPTIAFGDINWSEKVNNTGANYFRSNYTVSLKTIWGSTVENHTDSALIISSSIRLVSGQLPAPQWLGVYKLSATFGLGDNGDQTNSRWIVYLPVSQIIIFVTLLIAIILVVHRQRTPHQKKTKKD